MLYSTVYTRLDTIIITTNLVMLRTESKTGGRSSLSRPTLYQSLYGMYDVRNIVRRFRQQ